MNMLVGSISQLTVDPQIITPQFKTANIISSKKKYVLGFAFSQDRNKVLLIQKNRPDWMAGHLNGIGGKIESFEIDRTPSSAMCREFWEECGINTTDQDWFHYMTVDGRNCQIWVYRSFMDIHNFETKTDEEIVIKEIREIRCNDELIKVSNLRWMIEAALDENYGNPFHLTSTYY